MGGTTLPVNASPDGFLASAVTIETGLGSTECPWRLTVPAGQRINLTLYDFLVPQYSPNDVPIQAERRQSDTRRQGDTGRQGGTYCHRYASIRESGSVRSTVVCGGETRMKVVYLSATNQVDVTISTYRLPEKRARFLLKYQGKSAVMHPYVHFSFILLFVHSFLCSFARLASPRPAPPRPAPPRPAPPRPAPPRPAPPRPAPPRLASPLCAVLYCAVLYCTVLYCTVLYCTVLYCTVLYCIVLIN